MSEFKVLVGCSFDQMTGHRFSFHLVPNDDPDRSGFTVPYWTGASNHLVCSHLVGVDWPKFDAALADADSLHYLRTIELSEEDLSHLERFRAIQIFDEGDSFRAHALGIRIE